jgi:molybdopterin converting factor small subunit
MAVVRIPVPLRQHTQGAKAVTVSGETLAGALEHLTGQWPGLRPRLLNGDGQVHPFVNVFVDGEDVRLGQGLATPLRAGAEIDIIPAMAGGARSPLHERHEPAERCFPAPKPEGEAADPYPLV